MTADDGTGSGVAGIEYSTGPVGWTDYEGEVLITETTTVDFRATDYTDNTSIAGQITLTIEPLSFDISMAASTTEVEVGAVTVPVENITTAIQNAAGAGTTTASTPLSSIPLSSIPLSSIPLSSIPLSSIPLSSIPLSSIPLSSIPLSSIPLSSILVSQLGTSFDGGLDDLLLGTPLDEVPLQAITFNDLVSVPLSSIPLSSIPLSSIPLSSIPLSSIDAFFNCSGTFDCDGATLGQAFDAGAIGSGLELGDVLSFGSVSFESTPLSSIPLSSIALGTTPLSSIPLSSILVPATDLERLAEWCNVLGFDSGTAGCNLVNTGGTSLMTLALGGIPLSSIPLSSIPLSSIPLSSIPLSSIPLSSIFWASTPLSSIPLSSIPNVENLVDCGSADSAAGTLGSAVGAFLIGATVGDLDGLGSLDGFSLADLLFGLLAPTEIPWEEIDLNAARLPDAADPKQPTFTYDIELVVGGARSASINVDLVPPEGFYFARDLGITGPIYSTDPSYPTTLDGVQVADPVEDLNTGSLSLTLSGVAPGTHTLSIALRAGIVLGDHSASVTADATTTREDPIDAGPATASIEVVEAGEAGGGSIPTLVDGELNLSHISRSDDIDLYEFTVDEDLAGASAKILLSNLPADYDLVLYGPPVSAPLRGAPQPGFGLVEDFVFDLSPDDEVLDTETLQDVPTNPSAVNLTNEVLNSVSAKRGTTQEEIDTGTLRAGRYVVQVSSYNGAFNPSPFGLRIRLSETAERTCDAPAFSLGAQGSLPATPDNLNTLFLYNHARLVMEYPLSHQQVLDQLSLVATSDWTDLGVIGLVVPIDGSAAVWAALNQSKDDRCNPEASNNVVRAIGDLIDTYPDVENIVIIGDDAQIPMARIPDGTSVSNERRTRAHVQRQQRTGRLIARRLLPFGCPLRHVGRNRGQRPRVLRSRAGRGSVGGTPVRHRPGAGQLRDLRGDA